VFLEQDPEGVALANVLGRQDIAEEDLFHILGLDLGDSVYGGCGSETAPVSAGTQNDICIL